MADLRDHLLLRAFADGEHGDDRAHADDDSQKRQHGAENVRPERAHRQLERLIQTGENRRAPMRAFEPGEIDGICKRELLGFHGAAVLDHLAVLKLDHAIGVCGDTRIVRDEDDGVAFAREILEQRHDLGSALAVERAGRFVGEDHFSPVHQRSGNGDALLLAAGKLARAVGEAVAKPKRGQERLGAGTPLGLAEAGIDRRNLDVLFRRCRRQEIVALKDEAERFAPEPGERVRVEHGHVVTGEQIISRGRTIETAEQVHQRRLART